MKESLGTLFYMARNLKAIVKINRVKRGHEGAIAEVFVRKSEMDVVKIDIKITMLGSEGVGKSTLIGVLLTGANDNGNGSARINVLKHFHEIEEGRTTSIS